jgi:hypothetical protein
MQRWQPTQVGRPSAEKLRRQRRVTDFHSVHTENQPTQCNSSRAIGAFQWSRDETKGDAMAGKIAALLDTLTFRDVEALAPTERRSFAARCWFWAYFSERTSIEPLAGVLAELRDGYRVD